MRRQNHSCDQCRKAKRGCDAPPLESEQRHSAPGQSSAEFTARRCSYCLKTNKMCTMEWAKSQTIQRSASSPSNSPTVFNVEERLEETDGAHLPEIPLGSLLGKISPSYLSTLTSDMLDSDAIYFSNGDEYKFNSPIMSTQGFGDSFTEYSIPNDVALFQDELLEDPATVSDVAVETGSYCNPKQDNGIILPSYKRRRISRDTNSQSESLSPFSTDQAMISRTNNHTISGNLLRIYHDVLEHNLSCWLTEINCPLTHPSGNTDAESNTGLIKEWGFTWSNRIYSRAIQLDRESTSANIVRLTRAEDIAAKKALHLAIMAFATQWAQGSHRQREKYPTGFAYPNVHSPQNIAGGLAEEFDRSLQHQIWAQAQKALQDVDELESYRVALAELIFGLTQKPWDYEGDDLDIESIGIHSHGSDLKKEVLSRLNEIILTDGPPIYMERAARKVQILQARYNVARRGFRLQQVKRRKPTEATGDSSCSLSSESKKTAGLLYWFGVMFDTISSSMNERPVVVPDEDFPHYSNEDFYGTTSDQSDEFPTNERWDIRVFIHDDLENPAYLPSWPCPYENAAKAVAKSAPVKVLLYRHLSYLQGILRKGIRGRRVEDIIRSTISLYRYWNKTYGSFFREMMLDISSIPTRIRSWFFCISCHWNLAALMVADLIAFVDDNSLGVNIESCTRITGRIACRIRDAGVKELSELASISVPCNGLKNASNFHHAVNEGIILTEPWTMILIRAFSMASAILLGEADDTLRHSAAELGYTDGHCEAILGRVLNCIKALWHLGKKSDMARKAAEFLSLTTERLRVDHGIAVDI